MTTTPPAEVTATDFRLNIAEILTNAKYGHPTVITNNAKPIAKVVHPDADEGELACLRNRVAALEANGNELLARAEQAEAAIGRAEDLARTAKPGGSIPPVDCTNTCFYDACDCSGNWQPMSWKLNPADVLAALDAPAPTTRTETT